MPDLTNLLYGTLLRKFREEKGLNQELFASKCLLSRTWISQIETGKAYPHKDIRTAFAKALNEPVLEYYPQYRIEEFPERLKFRFQGEKEASQYLRKKQTSRDLDTVKSIFDLYKIACTQEDTTLMLALDESIHIKIMDAHPNRNLRNLVARYRQDFIELFKIWMPLLEIDIVRKLDEVHFKIFNAVLEQNQNSINEALDEHLDNSLNDVKKVKMHLK